MDGKRIFLILGVLIICGAMVICAFFYRQKHLETEKIRFLMAEIDKVNAEMMVTLKNTKAIEQENAGIQTEKDNYIDRLDMLKKTVAEVEIEKGRLQVELGKTEQETGQTRARLDTIMQQEAELSTGLQHARADYNDMLRKIEVFRNEKIQLEERIRNHVPSSKGVELKKIVVKMKPPVEGKVLETNTRHNFAVIDLGLQDNLKSGDVVDIYRRNEFIARAVAENIYDDMSSVIILDEWSDIRILTNDTVKVLRP